MDISPTLQNLIFNVVSFIFGGLSIYVTIRHRQSARITFIVEQSIGLFDAIVSRLRDISVQYKGRPVSERLVLLRGALFNTGLKDISRDMVGDKLKLMLPTDFRWISANIEPDAKGPKATVRITPDNVLEFDFDLLKSAEGLKFEALAEVSQQMGQKSDNSRNAGEILRKNISIYYRIAETRSPITGDLTTIIGPRRSVVNTLVFPAIILFMVSIVISISIFFPSSDGLTFLHHR